MTLWQRVGAAVPSGDKGVERVATATIEGIRSPSDPLVAQSLVELAGDFEDLISLTRQRIAALRRLRTELNRDTVSEWAGREVLAGIDSMVASDVATTSELRALIEETTREGSLAGLVLARRRQAEMLRTRQGMAASFFAATDWHSPSIGHSVHSNAGRHDGRITAHHDDYKRDRHPDQAAWERAWLAETVDNPRQHPLRALMTASGMAAFTTIRALIEQQKGEHPVVIGSGIYHECRQLLTMSGLGNRIIAVPETDKKAWKEALDRGPGVVFLDTMCNAAGLAVPDVVWLIRALHGNGRSMTLVLDNTARSVSFQPWRYLPNRSTVRMIVFESLTKYAQLGMDRAAGGVIVAREQDAEKMDSLREHLGTNVADVVAHQHPWPNRRLLQRRLSRIGRNAALIAGVVSRRIAGSEFPIRVIYPGLSTPSRVWDSSFRGGYMSIESRTPDDIPLYRRLIETVLSIAAERGVPICEGTSFGFDTTRVYLTAATTIQGSPFLRIAAGGEHLVGAHAVANVLADSVERLR
ncbi:MAG: PLP-dependent transferase [Acidimicrobiia bacterium]